MWALGGDFVLVSQAQVPEASQGTHGAAPAGHAGPGGDA